MSWVLTSIPRFVERATPFQELLEAAYAAAGGSHEKKSVQKLPLAEPGWTAEHGTAFKDLQDQLLKATRLLHRSPGPTSSIGTDSSDKY